jgi:hypothetical protein
VVALPEHIGISSAGRVREELVPLVGRGAVTLIADVTATVCRGQAGARAVIRARTRACASGTELRPMVTAPVAAPVLRLAGLDRTDSPRKRMAEALDEPEGVIGEIRAAVSARCDPVRHGVI